MTGLTPVLLIQNHFAFVTKYHYKILEGHVHLNAQELIRPTYKAIEIEILR